MARSHLAVLFAWVAVAAASRAAPPTNGPVAANQQPHLAPLPAVAAPASGDSCGTGSACPSCAAGCCGTCGLDGAFWVRGEYLLWWLQGMNTPPLLTSSTAVTPGNIPGSLADPNARVVFGGDRVNDDLRQGFRVTAGGFLDEECRLGVQASFFLLASQGTASTQGSADGSAIVSRPFFEAATGRADAQIVSLPGDTAGFSTASARSGQVYGADALLRCNLCCGCNYRIDAVAGYRFLHLSEGLTVTEDLRPLTAPFVAGTRIQVRGSFETDNDFHGGTIGVVAEACRGPWGVEVMPRLGVGGVSRTVRIDGSTVVTVPGFGTTTNRGGLLALGSNIGTYHSSALALVPEVDLRLSYRVGAHAKLFVGYTGILWKDVARAGNQIDPTVNRDLIPPVTPTTGPQRPAFSLKETDVWLQGVQAGLEFRF